MINKSNALIVFTAYLTFCCCIYQIFYWYPFGINGLEMISFSDILQTTIIRLTEAFIYCVLNFSALSLFIYLIPSKKVDVNSFSKTWFIQSCIIIVVLTLFFILCLRPSVWILLPAISSSLLMTSIGKYELIFFSVKYKTVITKNTIIGICIFVGINSILTGYKDSSLVENNTSFKYVKINIPKEAPKAINNLCRPIKKDTLKFLGFKSSGEFVFVSMDNKDVYFIKSDTIVLKSYNKK